MSKVIIRFTLGNPNKPMFNDENFRFILLVGAILLVINSSGYFYYKSDKELTADFTCNGDEIILTVYKRFLGYYHSMKDEIYKPIDNLIKRSNSYKYAQVCLA